MKSKSCELTRLLSEFFTEYLPTTKGLSANTITAYQYAFRLLFGYLDNVKGIMPTKVSFETLSNGVIEEFLVHLEQERQCTAKTRNLRRSAIIAFAKYAAKKSFSASLPFYSEAITSAKKKELKNNIIKYFTKEEIQLLLKLPDTSKAIGQRDVAMLAALYATGARAQELCDITLKDITLATPSFPTKVRFTGKGKLWPFYFAKAKRMCSFHDNIVPYEIIMCCFPGFYRNSNLLLDLISKCCSTVSKVTDKILPMVAEWQSRPLDFVSVTSPLRDFSFTLFS